MACKQPSAVVAPFHQAINQLFFGVPLLDADASIINDFETKPELYYQGGVAQWNLNVSLLLDSADLKDAVIVRDKFTFTRSPVKGLRIKEGKIIVVTRENATDKKLKGIEWDVTFDNQADAGIFFDKLEAMFGSISVVDNPVTDDPTEKIVKFTPVDETPGVEYIKFRMYQPYKTGRYVISLDLYN